MICYSLESRLPETKIREYIKNFGADIVLCNDLIANEKLLEALKLREDFDLCNIEKENNLQAIKSSIRLCHIQLFKYLVDRLECKFELLVWCLILSKNSEALHYLVEKQYGTNIAPEFMPKILLSLIESFKDVYKVSNEDIKQSIIEFCHLLGWTGFMKRDNNQFLKDSHQEIMNDCLDLLSEVYSREYF